MDRQKVILVSEEFYEFVEALLTDSIFTAPAYLRAVMRAAVADDFNYNLTVVPKP